MEFYCQPCAHFLSDYQIKAFCAFNSLIFKYAASEWVWRRCEERPSWAAIARVSEESGFRGVLMIRFSIVPPSKYLASHQGLSAKLMSYTLISRSCKSHFCDYRHESMAVSFRISPTGLR